MSISGKVWGGPFKAPPMVQPVSVGWVFLKILETLWRTVLVLCVLVALFAAGIWVSEGSPLASQVKVQLGGQGTSCAEKEYPLDVALTNESGKTLGEINLKFRVYEQGKSKDISTYMSSTPQLNDILGPGRSIFYCFGMPKLEPGSTAPYTLAVEVTSASEVSKGVPGIAGETTTDHGPMPRSWWVQIATGIGAVLGFIMFASGGYGLIFFIDRIFKTQVMERVSFDEGDNSGCALTIVAGVGNAVLVMFVGYALSAIGWGGWIDNLDAWSRSRGFADSAVLILTVVACQWPWGVLIALPARDEAAIP